MSETKEKYLWHTLSVEEVFKLLDTKETGLTKQEAELRLKKYDYNEIIGKKPDSALKIFLSQFKSPLIYILIFAAIISLLVGKTSNAIVIFAVLTINAVMGFIQENRARKTMENLKRLPSLADRKNMVYSGTVVVSGKGKAVVVATGMDTELGKIAHIIQTTAEPKTPFQRKMEKFGKFLIVLVSAQVLIAFIIGKFVRNLPFYDIFMVALSQMVSSIPEGLPVAVTVALAVGMH